MDVVTTSDNHELIIILILFLRLPPRKSSNKLTRRGPHARFPGALLLGYLPSRRGGSWWSQRRRDRNSEGRTLSSSNRIRGSSKSSSFVALAVVGLFPAPTLAL